MASPARRRRLAYKFLPAEFALQDLIKREIKISTFPDMNDPFELLGGLPVSPSVAQAFEVMINWLSEYGGVLCLSQDWRNAMLWSHYGDKHNGMCLGLNIGPAAQVSKPRYVKTRKRFDPQMRILLKAAARLPATRKSTKLPPDYEKAVRRLLLTKFEEWKYENKVRVFIKLKEEQKRGGYYFAELDDDFQPVSLILGPRCRTTDREIASATCGYSTPIKIVRTVLAPNSFQVIEAS